VLTEEVIQQRTRAGELSPNDLHYKLKGRKWRFVFPLRSSKPSQTCPKCLRNKKKRIDVRTHNSSKVWVYSRSRRRQSGSHDSFWANLYVWNELSSDVEPQALSTKERKNCGLMKQSGSEEASKNNRSVDGNFQKPQSSARRQGRGSSFDIQRLSAS